MNLKEAKIMLEKINRLYESMIIDSKMDPFEQELMLSYIKKLYVAFSLDGESMNMVSQNRNSEKPSVVPEPPQPRVIKRIVTDQPTIVPSPPKPAPTPEPVEEIVVEPVVESVPESVRPAPTPKPAPVALPPKAVKTDEEVSLLFEDQEGKELSDKLASLPIRDLTKAMGLNERILTVNELFGKDQQAFTTAMSTMNQMKDFEETKTYLVECAEKYNWTEKNKTKKAQIFIKLVRRRFK